jgi:pyruvate dehydrogenase E2 component (dihydrolipoamide acetyltransferase)
MEEGTVVKCLVKVGDEVKKGDVIFEIETDKATLEMESPTNGFVKFIVAQIGWTLPVGAVLMVLGDVDEHVPMEAIEADGRQGLAPRRGNPAAQMPTTIALPTSCSSRKPMSKIAAEGEETGEDLGVSLATVKGTGPAGKITEQTCKTPRPQTGETRRCPNCPPRRGDDPLSQATSKHGEGQPSPTDHR